MFQCSRLSPLRTCVALTLYISFPSFLFLRSCCVRWDSLFIHYRSLHLCQSIFIHSSVNLFVRHTFYLSTVSIYSNMSLYLFNCLHIYSSTSLSIHFVYLFKYLYLTVDIFIYPPLYLSILSVYSNVSLSI